MAEIVADNSDQVPTIPDTVPTIQETVPTIQENVEVPADIRPKTRGRPWGSKDGKPRIRRVPVVIKQEEEPAAPAEQAQPAATKMVQFAEQVVEEPPMKSPRTLHREHVQTLATERRKLAQARQAHYESLLAHNLSW